MTPELDFVMRIQVLSLTGEVLTQDDQVLQPPEESSDTQVTTFNTSHLVAAPDGTKYVIGARVECFRITLPDPART